MKIVYLGRSSQRNNPPPKLEGDTLELLENNWDDFGYKTTFMTTCRIKGKAVELGHIKILVDGEGVKTTATYFNELRQKGWNGEFPIPNCNYISVPGEITFYEQLKALLNDDGCIIAALALKDASYLVHVKEDEKAIKLINQEGFNSSLQRERGDVKAYMDGWNIFTHQETKILDLSFLFNDVFENVSKLELKFEDKGLLPHEINVLIGANGAGKSQILHQIVKDWLQSDVLVDNDVGFVEKPNLSQIVVVSYSPFERFPVDLAEYRLQDKEAYRYFGFRDRVATKGEGHSDKILLSHNAPKKDSSSSLIMCLTDDKRYRALENWAQKLKTAENVLRSAFAFDYAAVRVGKNIPPKDFYTNPNNVGELFIDIEDKRFIPISSELIDDLSPETLSENLIAGEGVSFFRDGKIVGMSSGQKLFSFIVVNILGVMRRDSLILIDEPELFLHPNLEIQFIEMLKKILKRFNSKALLATHSVVTVREIPADCVHVLERTDDGLVIKRPPFQTFGGDVQRITSYVFGDSAISKPFEKWIKENLQSYGDSESLIEALKGDINEELIVQIRAMDE